MKIQMLNIQSSFTCILYLPGVGTLHSVFHKISCMVTLFYIIVVIYRAFRPAKIVFKGVCN